MSGVGVTGPVGWGGQSVCEQRIEVIVKMQKNGSGIRVEVN